jgi:hypothetical protein
MGESVRIARIDDRYSVDTEGNVYGTKGLLKNQVVCKAYHAVTIDKKSVYVHRLVAQAFIPNPDNKPDVAHIDGDGFNNHVSNLRWSTEKENMADKVTHGTACVGDSHPGRKLTSDQVSDIRGLRAEGVSVTYLAALYKVSKWAVYDMCNSKRTWKTGS